MNSYPIQLARGIDLVIAGQALTTHRDVILHGMKSYVEPIKMLCTSHTDGDAK